MNHADYSNVQLYTIIPFILMLAAIAVLPLKFNHFWEKNQNKLIISIVLSVPVLIYLLVNGFTHEIIHTMLFDYIPFIILLGSLFTITGGILLKGDIQAKPSINTLFLGIGAVLASFMGTTGAAMLLIRPVIKTNQERTFKVHTILFFIAIVANCGGLLTPLGDPPLFMMYLRGAPFEWFLGLVKEWFVVNALLLTLYYFVDSYYYKKEPEISITKDKSEVEPLKLQGKRNFIFLIGVVLSVEFINEFYLPFMKTNEYFKFIREIVILSMGLLSLKFTENEIRKQNNFTWHPIEEVAYLFLGIFFTMIPALMYLQSHAKELGISTPPQFYYYTGLLSSFLDNTPTAVTFHSLALGLGVKTKDIIAGIPENILVAISVASVLFGSMTYIGNGPNFMVKAVAEENKIKMPDFFSYIFKFSLIVLLPIFILIQLLFIH
ncbi:MAG: sodium:proton antiporter [Ignavibacterium sp.]|nr:sodium:proton antiporter [Ignavibacterium sp.]MCX7610672.1 sodium:proton antiporter [Ignavibacterium sp.]MDW8375524.1 sodium:proton antiporter [Ignavibacteriales bacterium]